MAVDSQPADLIVNEAHDAPDPTGRDCTRTRITAPAVIGQLVAGLLYLRLAPEDSVTIPTGAQAGDLSLDPCTYQGYEADCGTLTVPEACWSGARVRSSGWGPRSRLTRSQPPRGART